MRHTRTMHMAQETGSYFVKTAGFVAVAALLVAALPAGASNNNDDTGTIVWMPYGTTQLNWTAHTQCWWGNTNNPIYKKFGDPSTDNAIWSLSRVFYNQPAGRSWYTLAGEKGDGSDTYSQWWWHAFVHNPNASSIAVEITVWIDGVQADGNTRWPSPNLSPADLLINQSPGGTMEWIATESGQTVNHFHLTVAAGTTVRVNCWGTPVIGNQLFNTPSQPYQVLWPAIRFRQASGYPFLLSASGDCLGYARDANYGDYRDFTNALRPSGWAYEGIQKDRYNTGPNDTNTIFLPMFRETYSADDTAPEFATRIWLLNAYPGSDFLAFDVYALDGTRIGERKYALMGKYTTLYWAPSQFATNESQQNGYVKITGKRPMAIAFFERICKTEYTVSGQYTRVPSFKIMNFAINGTF